jgi:K+-transporting ATPase ATPase C chain
MSILLQLRRAVVVSVIFLVICGLAYPLAVTGIAQAGLSHEANGSIGPNGSVLIGQKWQGTKWFHGRPGSYNDEETGPTNLGPHSKVLLEHVKKRIAYWEARGVKPTPELVESSASGVDPDISPASAYAQVPMVAKARGIAASKLDALIKRETRGPQWGFLGASYVNVLELNEALARMAGR